MNVSMMQPGFMPWLGLFELIFKSDCFIFLDDFQFSVQSWDQRNRLFVNKGQVGWFTVPVIKSLSFLASLNQTQINESMPWRVKMWKRLQQNYSKTIYYNMLSPLIEEWLLTPASSLAEQNINFIKMVCMLLDLRRKFLLSSQHPSGLKRSAKVIELLRWSGAEIYYCAKGSFDYMLSDGIFPVDDIEVLFQDHRSKPYEQIGSKETFIPFLSVLDVLFNAGPETTIELIMNGTDKWMTWDEMMQNSIIHC